MATIRIILADDHTVLRTGLKLLIDNQPDFAVVGEAADGEALLALVEHTGGLRDGNDGSGDAVPNVDLPAALGQRGLHERGEFALGRHFFGVRRMVCHDRSEKKVGDFWARKRRRAL